MREQEGTLSSNVVYCERTDGHGQAAAAATQSSGEGKDTRPAGAHSLKTWLAYLKVAFHYVKPREPYKKSTDPASSPVCL